MGNRVIYKKFFKTKLAHAVFRVSAHNHGGKGCTTSLSAFKHGGFMRGGIRLAPEHGGIVGSPNWHTFTKLAHLHNVSQSSIALTETSSCLDICGIDLPDAYRWKASFLAHFSAEGSKPCLLRFFLTPSTVSPTSSAI